MVFLGLIGGEGGPGALICFCFLVTIFLLKTSKNVTKHMVLSFRMKGGVISNHYLMPWFQKDSLNLVGFMTDKNIGQNVHQLSPSLFVRLDGRSDQSGQFWCPGSSSQFHVFSSVTLV